MNASNRSLSARPGSRNISPQPQPNAVTSFRMPNCTILRLLKTLNLNGTQQGQLSKTIPQTTSWTIKLLPTLRILIATFCNDRLCACLLNTADFLDERERAQYLCELREFFGCAPEKEIERPKSDTKSGFSRANGRVSCIRTRRKYILKAIPIYCMYIERKKTVVSPQHPIFFCCGFWRQGLCTMLAGAENEPYGLNISK